MRQLVTIQNVLDIMPIEGADNIELAKINNWQCVVKKGELKKGEFCVYFEIDSLLPSDNPAFQFLAKGNKEKMMIADGVTYKGYRLKTIRLRGQLSQGLALPLSIIPASFTFTAMVGQDLSEILKIVKYEAPIPAELAGKVKGNFPGFLRKTDEERIQNIGDVITRKAGERCYITEKLDGASATFYKKDGIFGVCSRNLELLETEGNTLWGLAKKYELSVRLPDGFAVQGEVIGEGVQTNPLKIKGHELYVYNVYDIFNGKFLDYDEFIGFCAMYGLKTVPVINESYILEGDVKVLLAMADGKSKINIEALREGLVIRPLTEQREVMRGVESRFSFKVISNDYLLNE